MEHFRRTSQALLREITQEGLVHLLFPMDKLGQLEHAGGIVSIYFPEIT